MFWAAAVLLLAALFRLLLLPDVPPGLAQDEVLNADIATFIRQGQHAFFFREGYGHEPLYHYWAVPFQILFGDNVLSIRLPAVYLGLMLIALVLRWARREFGAVTAVAAGIAIAVSWPPIIFSRIGIRPILEPVLLVAAAWFWRRPWLAGLFLGLSLYSYTGARVIFLIPLLVGVLQFFLAGDGQMRRRVVRATAVILFTALIIYAPMQFTLQADPSLQQRVDQLAGPLDALLQGDIAPIWRSTRATLGVFSFTGDPRWTYTLPGRPLFDPVTAVLFYAGLLIALRNWREPRYHLILIWLGVTMLPSAITPQAPSIIRLIGALPVIYLLPGIAIAAGVKRLPQSRHWQTAVGLLLGLILLGNAARTVNNGFIQWPQALETRLKYQTVLLDIARHWQANPSARLVVADGFFEPIDADSLRRDLGTDPGARWVQTGADVSGALVFPAGAGEDGRFYVPEYAPVPTDLLKIGGVAERPLFRSPSHPSFAVYALPAPPTPPIPIPPVTLDGAITLVGYQIATVEAERPLRLYTYWQVQAPLPADLTAFAHILAADGSVIAQHDGFDAAPATLLPGDWIIQRHLIPLSANLTDEPVTLQVGLYRRSSGQRLNCGCDETPSDSIILRDNWPLTESR